jgi:hypothetical protein
MWYICLRDGGGIENLACIKRSGMLGSEEKSKAIWMAFLKFFPKIILYKFTKIDQC